MAANGSSLRELYRNLETPGTNRLRAARAALRTAYGMSPSEDPVTFLLRLNLELAETEKNAKTITTPGLPACGLNPDEFVSAGCIHPR